MTAFTTQETGQTWRPQRREEPVRLYFAGAEGDTGELAGVRVCGLPLELNLVPVTDWIDPEDLAGAAVAVIQVDSATPASVKRFQKLAKSSDTPLIVAAYDPPLALVRSLLRNGAVDVLPLPLDIVELETSIRQIQEQQGSSSVEAGKAGRTSNIVTVLKAAGGVGATTLVAQLAARFATNEAAHGREACLLDLDLQFGDAAFQLGMQTGLSVADLLAAGSRLDGSLIRATSTRHESGLHVISAPRELMPVEGHSSDDFIHIADAAAREFGTAFVELPTNWTKWSVSLIARSDLVLLVAELTITSLNRARRQLELLRAEGLGDLNVRVVINRFDKSQLRTIRASDVREALGYEISDTIANDPAIMRTASDRGVTIDQVKRKSTVGKDINLLDAGIAAALGLER
jgi:pilus assembly protein CpaE